MTTEARDVLQALAPVSQVDLFSRPEVEEPPAEREIPMSVPPSEDERFRIIDALGPTPVDIDDVIRHTGVSANQVYLVLLELDLAGRLHRHPGGMVSIADFDH